MQRFLEHSNMETAPVMPVDVESGTSSKLSTAAIHVANQPFTVAFKVVAEKVTTLIDLSTDQSKLLLSSMGSTALDISSSLTLILVSRKL